MNTSRNSMRLAILLSASSCLLAADPIFMRRQMSDVKPQADDLTANSKAASYKPLFGIGDQDVSQLKGVARYGELTVGPGGTSAVVSYPAEEQMYFVEEGSGTMLYGDEKAAVRKNDFLYLPIGVPHGVANSSGAPIKVIVMGYKIPDGAKVQPTRNLCSPMRMTSRCRSWDSTAPPPSSSS
jgi:mannose-6-phosphate isomerase-like protein (cupin superfamily)